MESGKDIDIKGSEAGGKKLVDLQDLLGQLLLAYWRGGTATYEVEASK